MKTDCLKGIDTLRYSDIFLAMYSDNGSSCLHRNHSHVLVYMYSGELEIKEHKEITRLHKGDCAFIRKDFSVQLTKQACKMEQFKAVFLMFTDKFLRNFYCRLDKESLPENARRSKVSLYRLPSDRPDIVSLFESMTPILQFRHPTYGRTVGIEDDRRIVRTPEYGQEPVCLAFRLRRPVENRHHGLHGTELHERPYAGGNGQLYRAELATFKRDFNKVSDLSPQKWVIRRRLEAAHALILSGTRKVTDVCYRVGFKNLSHFSKSIRDCTDIPLPTAIDLFIQTNGLMDIQGQENQLILAFPDREVRCLDTADNRINRMLERSNISIIGNNNRVLLHFESEDSAEELLTGAGFLLIVKGDGNEVDMGTVIVRCSSILGMTGLKLIIGQLPDWSAGVSRTANGCSVTIGDRVVINGVTLYLQEDHSRVSIGDDSQLSWGVDVWCTDAHTITDLEGNPVNYAESIEIGRHVWVGKDVKIRQECANRRQQHCRLGAASLPNGSTSRT